MWLVSLGSVHMGSAQPRVFSTKNFLSASPSKVRKQRSAVAASLPSPPPLAPPHRIFGTQLPETAADSIMPLTPPDMHRIEPPTSSSRPTLTLGGGTNKDSASSASFA